MTSSYTANLGLQQPATGDQTNSWGTTVNTDWTIVDNAVAGLASINLPAQSGYPTVVLTFSQGSATQQLPNRRLVFTGTLTANTLVLFPQGRNAHFAAENNCTGAYTLTLGVNNNSGGALGSTVVVPQGQTMELFNDGTNIVAEANAIGGSLAVNGALSATTPIAVSSGGTGAASFGAAGLVTGPASAGAGNLPSFADTTGKVLQDSGIPATTLGVPSGTVLPFAGSTAPTGFLLANGQSVSTTTYATLFGIIGYTFGGSGGSFNVPDLRGRLVAGYDPSNATGRLTQSTTQGVSASTIGNTGGEQAHTQQVSELVSHNHSISDPTHDHTVAPPVIINQSGSGSYTGAVGTGGTSPWPTSSVSTGISINNTGGGSPFNVVAPAIVLNYIIKT